ncbi:MAG: hypothetical protein KBD01_11810 [Acidobacteria bacterium]|nr:hypothetical protein [Acidobacteriota bacterium]
MKPLAILDAGMVTPVGFNAAASCAAIRAGITGFAETRFMFAGRWLMGAEVPFDEGWRGPEKLLRLVVPAIAECLHRNREVRPGTTALLLCVAEAERRGGIEIDGSRFLSAVESALSLTFSADSRVFAGGRIGGARAVEHAAELLAHGMRHVIVAGVDSLLTAGALAALDHDRRLLTAANSDGLIPGEAGAAVLVAAGPAPNTDSLLCVGIGFGREPSAEDPERPLRADGLADAFRAAFTAANVGWEAVDYRLTDISGEQQRFKEAALALTRTVRQRKETFELWHPADCIGEVGAAALPVVLGVALAASRNAYAPGPGVLCHFSAEGPERAALILRRPDRSQN